MSVNTAHLRAFHAVATEGGFTAAARALRVSQPTLSSQVKALEERYGVRLFQRVRRGVSPTDLGRDLHAVTLRLFSVEREAEELLSAARGLELGHLRVGADGPHHVVPLLGRFTRRHPGLEVTLEMGNSERVLGALREGRVDVAVLARLDPDDPRLHAVALRTSRLVLFVSRRHPWGRRRAVRLAEIASERLVMREAASTTRRLFEAALRRRGVAPRSVLEIESREAVREAVAAGLGVGVVSEAELDPDRRLRALAIRDEDVRITEHVACLAEQRRVRIVAAFLDVVGAATDTGG